MTELHPASALTEPCVCPVCRQTTDSLKAYRLPTSVLFLGIAASFQHGEVVACPRCMRKELARLALVNLLPANLMWVALLLPWYSIAGLRTLTSGHSRSRAVAALRPSALRAPPRIVHDGHELARFGVAVLPPDTEVDTLRAFCEESAPDASLELDETHALFVVRASNVVPVANRFGYVSPGRALEMTDSMDPAEVLQGMRMANAYDSVGLLRRLPALKHHSHDEVREAAARIDRAREEARYLRERARKR